MTDNEQWITRRWHRRSDRRYYLALLHQDLWGGWVLTVVWGRSGTALGQVRNLPCNSYDAGVARLDEIARRRYRRGYRDA